jgi:tetratricopeptide (TPR) repeat protein
MFKKRLYILYYIILTFLMSSCLWISCNVYADDAKSLYDKGTDLLRQGELDDALISFNESLSQLIGKSDLTAEEKNQLSESYNNRGLVYYEKKDYTNAEIDFTQAKEWNYLNFKAINNLALVYYVLEDYSNAILEYLSAIDLIDEGEEEPMHADIYNNLGVSYLKQPVPDFSEAMKAYNKAIQISQKDFSGDILIKSVGYTEAYYNRGNLYYNLKAYNDAINDYTITIDFYENSKKSEESDVLELAYYNRGLSYYNLNNFASAILDYTKSIEQNPGNMWTHYAKGFAHYMLNEDIDAEIEFQLVLGFEIDAYARFGLGLLYCKKTESFDDGMDYLKESCSSGSCDIACEALEQGLYADPGTILYFELPEK